MQALGIIETLNGPLGWRCLRNRGRTRDWLARQIVAGRERRLGHILANLEAVRLSARAAGIPVSLTSWKPRLKDLPLVLLGLLEQTVRPAAIDVWLTPEDEKALDGRMKTFFSSHGVRFQRCDDLGPHKKWLPRVNSGQTGAFAICDDDILYPDDWLERLLSEDRADAYVGVRCHRMRWSPDGVLRPYLEWEKEIRHVRSPGHDLFITGCGGAILHPRRLGREYLDRDRIMEECPWADDIWLKAAHAAAGIPCFKTRFSFPCLEIPGSQASGLLGANVDQGRNDRQMGILNQLMSQRS